MDGRDLAISVGISIIASKLITPTLSIPNPSIPVGLSLSNINALALGIASSGTGNDASRFDHVHPIPTAAQIGADPAGSAASAQSAAATYTDTKSSAAQSAAIAAAAIQSASDSSTAQSNAISTSSADATSKANSAQSASIAAAAADATTKANAAQTAAISAAAIQSASDSAAVSLWHAYMFAACDNLPTSESFYKFLYSNTLGSGASDSIRVRLPAGKTIKLRVCNGSIDVTVGQTATFKLYTSTIFGSGFTSKKTISWPSGTGTNTSLTSTAYTIGASPEWVCVSCINPTAGTGGGWYVEIIDG